MDLDILPSKEKWNEINNITETKFGKNLILINNEKFEWQINGGMYWSQNKALF